MRLLISLCSVKYLPSESKFCVVQLAGKSISGSGRPPGRKGKLKEFPRMESEAGAGARLIDMEFRAVAPACWTGTSVKPVTSPVAKSL